MTENPQNTGFINYNIKDSVLHLEFGHPLGNSLPSNLLSGLKNSITTASTDDSIKVILLKSSGNSFCGGASFNELVKIDNLEDATEFFMGFANLMLAIKECPKPVVAKVHGKSVGGGLGIIAASDWAIGTEKSSIRLSEISIGIGPFTIGPVLVRKIGVGNFQRLSLSADWIDSNWGLNSGLFQEICNSDALETVTESRIEHFKKLDPISFAENKKLMWSFSDITEDSLRVKASNVSKLLLNQNTQSILKSLTSK
jgi:methylglutaconyl-CoA hydratase